MLKYILLALAATGINALLIENYFTTHTTILALSLLVTTIEIYLQKKKINQANNLLRKGSLASRKRRMIHLAFYAIFIVCTGFTLWAKTMVQLSLNDRLIMLTSFIGIFIIYVYLAFKTIEKDMDEAFHS